MLDRPEDGRPAAEPLDSLTAAEPLQGGGEFLVNALTSGHQFAADTTRLLDGRTLVTWTDEGGSDGSGAGIKARLFSPGGTPLGAEFLVNSVTAGTQYSSSSTALADGGFVIVWEGVGSIPAEDFQDIKLQLFDSTGAKRGSELFVNAVTAGGQFSPTIVQTPSGGLTVAYMSNGAPTIRFLDSNGLARGEEIVVSPWANWEEGREGLRLTVLANGNLVLCWRQRLQPGDPDGYGVVARVLSPGGIPLGPVFSVNSRTNGDQTSPEIAALPNGNFVIVWEDFDRIGTPFAIRGQLYSPTGIPVGAEFRVNEHDSTSAQSPAIVVWSGGFAVSWTENTRTTLGDIAFRVFDSNGTPVSGDVPANMVLAGLRDQSDIAYVNGQGFALVWQDFSQTSDRSGWGIKGRLFEFSVQAKPVLFDESPNQVSFDSLRPEDFTGTFVSAQGGDDIVYLPLSGSAALGWGLVSTFDGGAGNDRITAGAYFLDIRGGEGDDILVGSSGESTLDGGPGADMLQHNGSGEEDSNTDLLIGGAGLDRFAVGDGDTVQDAEPGERIELDGALEGTLFFVTSRDDSGGYRIVRVEQSGDELIEAASARILAPVPVWFDFGTGEGGTQLLVRAAAADPVERLSGGLEAEAEAGIIAKGEALGRVIAEEAAKFIGDHAEGKAKEGLAALAAHYVFNAPFKLTFKLLGSAPIVDFAEIVVGLTNFWIQKFAGAYESRAEENAAFRQALDPLIEKVVAIVRIGAAGVEFAEAIADWVVGKSLQIVTRLIDEHPLLRSVPDAQGRLAGTDGGEPLVGDDRDNLLQPLGGDDSVVGGRGNDRVDYRTSPGGVMIDLGRGRAEAVGEAPPSSRPSFAPAMAAASFGSVPIGVDSISGVEGALGSEHDDVLIGDGGANHLDGGGGDDGIEGAAGNDILIAGAGTDHLEGGEGNDVLYFGTGLSTGDVADGGEGRDAIVLQGNVTAVLSETNLVGIESISIQSGANSFFGDAANNFYDYNVTTADGNVASGQQLIVNGQSLRAGEDFTFDGSAESDGRFVVYGGHGTDDLTGGDGADVFFFEGQRWGPSDKVDGGAGRDSVAISAGNGLNRIEFGADSLTRIESISVNNFFATDPSQKPSYDLVLHNGNVAAGLTLIVNGSSIPLGQVVNIDGRGVHDGNLILFGGGGHDVVLGGDGADLIVGGSGADGLAGGAGADTFRYDSASDSVAGLEDLIADFQTGIDRIDLGRIDADSHAAGNQAFSWIGTNAFSGTGAASAGELRTYEQGGYRWVAGDTNGDGFADLVIVLQQGTAPLVQGDFLL